VVVSVVLEGVDASGVAVAIGDEVVLMVVLVSVFDVAGDGFTIVVLLSVFSGAGDAAGAVVSVFCSQAARSAALARMQMYFFISFRIECPYMGQRLIRGKGSFRSCLNLSLRGPQPEAYNGASYFKPCASATA
jgi:hypothetical protein